MAISQCMVTSFKVELLTATHNFTASTGDVFKMALYTAAATLNAGTTVYTSTNEVVGSGYTAGGATLVNITPTSADTVGFTSFQNPAWPASTITARGALIYNSSKGNKAVAVLDFGADKTSVASTFTVQMPSATSTTAIVRIA